MNSWNSLLEKTRPLSDIGTWDGPKVENENYSLFMIVTVTSNMYFQPLHMNADNDNVHFAIQWSHIINVDSKPWLSVKDLVLHKYYIFNSLS